MINYPVTLTPSGGVVLPGYASALALGYLTEAEFDSWVRPEEMVGSLAIR